MFTQRHRHNIVVASVLSTLTDLSQTQAVQGCYVHCLFSFSVFERQQKALIPKLIKSGLRGLYFQEIGMVKLID